MQEFCTAVLPVRQDGQAWQVGLFGGAWQTITTADGKMPVEMPPDFRPVACLDFWGDGHLLLLAHPHGGKTTWVLDEAFRTLCDLSDPALDSMPSVRQVLAGPASALRRSMRARLVFPADGVTGIALRGMPADAVARFLSMAQGRARSLPGSAYAGADAVSRLGGVPVGAGALDHILGLAPGWAGPAEIDRLGGVPALGGEGLARAVCLVGRNGRLPILRCVEQEGRFPHYVLFREDASPALYVPGDNVFVSRDAVDAVTARGLLATLDAALARMASALAVMDVAQLPDATDGLGLITAGVPGMTNPRQGLVQEVDALASVLAARPPDQASPTTFVTQGSGLDSCWTLEELFPELAGCVVRVPDEAAAMVQAALSGTTILLRDGTLSSPAARARIRAAVDRTARPGLADQVAAVCARGGVPNIVVALCFRPSAASAVDLMSFYGRLAKALVGRFGRAVFLLDGGSQEEAGTASADGQGWAAAIRTVLGPLDAEVVELTGLPVRDGLCWLRNATFFVAQLGEGLVRLRWMLDLPGLVLQEEREAAGSEDPLRLFRDAAVLGGPAAPLHSGRMDGTQLARQAQGATGRRGRTQPKAPVLHEDGLIERISDLVAAQASGSGLVVRPEPNLTPPRAPRRGLRALFKRRPRRAAPIVVPAAASGASPLVRGAPAPVELPQGPGLRCVDIVKDYPVHHGRRRVLDGINLELARGQKLGILGRNGAGKSTLIRIIGGVDLPTAGRVVSNMSVSWPLGFTGAFQGSLSGIDNLRFICRIYGLDYQDTRHFVDDFAELGSQLGEPVKTYSSGMRARLAFALSIAIEFDCYLIDEVIMVGDKRFTDRCKRELFEKRADRSLILVSHDMGIIRSVCDTGAVLHERQLHLCDSVADAVSFYEGM